jgi:hypothetical protein
VVLVRPAGPDPLAQLLQRLTVERHADSLTQPDLNDR